MKEDPSKKRIKELENEVETLKLTIKNQKLSHLSMSASLSKLLQYLDDPNFNNSDWIRFLLTRIYYSYLFQREDEDYQKGAEYIKGIVKLYP
jgi:hypothetical protein